MSYLTNLKKILVRKSVFELRGQNSLKVKQSSCWRRNLFINVAIIQQNDCYALFITGPQIDKIAFYLMEFMVTNVSIIVEALVEVDTFSSCFGKEFNQKSCSLLDMLNAVEKCKTVYKISL